jgi:hypothetical protein
VGTFLFLALSSAFLLGMVAGVFTRQLSTDPASRSSPRSSASCDHDARGCPRGRRAGAERPEEVDPASPTTRHKTAAAIMQATSAMHLPPYAMPPRLAEPQLSTDRGG